MDRFDEMRGKTTFSAGGGGAVIIPPEAGELVAIRFDSLPVKVDYDEGDTIDIKGMRVIAEFDNDVYIDVTSACEIVVDNPLTVYTDTVTVRYEGLELNYSITVYSEPEDIPSGTKVLLHFDDSLLNEINDTLLGTGNPNYGNGIFSKALTSGTSGSATNHGLLHPYQIPYSTATIEFWAYVNSYSTYSDPLFLYGYSGASNGISIYVNSTKVGMRMIADSNSTSSNKIPPTVEASFTGALKQWVHYAFTFDKGTYSIFVNGQLLVRSSSSYDGTGLWGNADLIFYGNKGYFDEFVFSHEVLYEDDFTPPTAPYGGERTLERIYIDTPPTKTIYQVGETFSMDGIKVMAVYSNGLITNVTGGCVIENNTPLTTSDTHRMITYTYKGLKKSVYVNVGAYTTEEDVDLSSTKLLMNFDGNTEDLTGINTPTIVGNSTYGEGKFGQARYFNGTTDYISMPYTEDINIDTGDFTIAFWVKGTSTSNIPVFLSIFKSLNNTNTGLRCGLNSGKLFVTFSSAEGTALDITNNTYPVNISNWLHIAIVRKGNNMACYENGKLVNSVTHEGRLYFGNNVIIGARDLNGMTNFYNGYIDDLIITKSALWDSEFTPPNRSLVQEGTVGLDVPKKLSGLALTNEPAKTMYKVGETFSLDGAKIMAYYTNGTEEDVTLDCEIIGDTLINGGTQGITVKYTYEGITKDLTINVWGYAVESDVDLSQAKILYNFDGETVDAIGSSVAETFGNEIYRNGIFGASRLFNGSTDYVRITHNENFDDGDFTIAFWMKPLDISKRQTMVNMNEMTSSETVRYGVIIGTTVNGNITAYVTDTTGTLSELCPTDTIPVSKDMWTHLAITRKDNTYTTYKDGKKIGSITPSSKVNFEKVILIGTQKWKNTPEFYYTGYIDDLIIAKSVLWDGEFIPPVKPYVANYTPIYTVTFKDNESILETQNIYEGFRAKEPSNMWKVGYILDYWNLDGKRYDFTEPITKDITLEAIWKEFPMYDYIETTGTQYIDTGVKNSANIRVVMCMAFLEGNTFYNGSEVGGTNGRYKWGLNGATQLGIGWGSNFYNYKIDTTNDSHKNYYIYDLANGNQKIMNENGDILASYTNTTLTRYATYNIHLFKLMVEGTLETQDGTARMKYCKIYNGNTLIRDFRGVLKEDTNEILPYDMVEGKFYPNLGTGEFMAG